MSETEQPQKKRTKKGLIVKSVIALLLVAGGGGGTYAFVYGGIGEPEESGKAKAKDKAKDEPKLVKKGEEDPYAPKAEGGEGGEGEGAEIDGEGGSAYRTSYYKFSDEFTSNLKHSSALMQISLACSTRRDGRVLMWLKKHELAIRSEILVVLADTPEEDAYTPTGKEQLQQRLAGAINKVLIQTEGFGGVDRVYFKSFLVQ